MSRTATDSLEANAANASHTRRQSISKCRSASYLQSNHQQPFRSSLLRTDGQSSIRLVADKLHRTDSQSSVKLDTSECDFTSSGHDFDRSSVGVAISENNDLDKSDNSSQSNNSAGNYMQRMRSRLHKRPFSRKHVPQTTPEDEVPILPESEVETIVQRLEERNANRVSVPTEVKSQFLRMCLNVCRLRVSDSNVDCGCGEGKLASDSPCILRDDVINMRNRVRVEVELRSRSRRIRDAIKAYCGFRCQSEVLLNVLNRAVDLIDSTGHAKARQRRRSRTTTSSSNEALNITSESSDQAAACPLKTQTDTDDEEWFYYKDFAFYSLKEESPYPWMRNPVLYSMLVTLSFYVMSPILWCSILHDENICPATEDGVHNNWMSALYFASVTISTVGYGDITILSGEEHVENWRVFIAIIFMILSLVVSVVGLQAGLDTQFNPFRRRIDLFLKRAYEIVNEKKAMDKHDAVVMRMRWYKIAEMTEVIMIFLMLNLLGMLALRIALAFDSGADAMSWMESFYWAVQTTTTIGYGDVDVPNSFKWFLLFYLAIGTYFVGNAIGKLRDVNKRLDAMRNLYLWQQQEASFEMLNDFSGRTDYTTTEDGRIVDVEPEIDQYEFTIASLVLLGKINAEDIRPIISKFKQLTSTNKITRADVAGPNKKKETPETIIDIEDNSKEPTQLRKSSTSSAVSVGKKIAIAFKEEVFGGSPMNTGDSLAGTDAVAVVADHKTFNLPKNTFAIGIDDSKIQRKLIHKFFTTAGVPEENCTVIGDGRDEIMGFEDFVVQYMEKHRDDFVFLIVDENLDVTGEDSKLHTISGSACVESIRKRLPADLESRMFALIRSANDSSSDLALYESRAHGFLAKAPIKKGDMMEILAPKWLNRFPPSEFAYSTESTLSHITADSQWDVASSPLDIEQKLNEIEHLFESEGSDATIHHIKDSMHELKGDLLTLNSNATVTPMIGLINLILAAQSHDTISDKWAVLRGQIKDVLSSLEKSFKLPSNVRALAIDDSKIQRKLLAKFFEFAGIASDQQLILGDRRDEIIEFEDLAVNYVKTHPKDFILMIVDENLDVESKDASKQESISGSRCVEHIRKRLSKEAERRVLALVRSANDSTSDISLYNIRCHGFLPKAPIRREKINETLASLWYERFPPSEFGLCLSDAADEIIAPSEDVACSSSDILQKLNEINLMFEGGFHLDEPKKINDSLHEMKGDLLTMTGFNVTMIGILGQINMILQCSFEPDDVRLKWETLYDKITEAIRSLDAPQDGNRRRSNKGSVIQMVRKRPTVLSTSLTTGF